VALSGLTTEKQGRDSQVMRFDLRYLQFFDLWNHRQHFECHEVLEDLWLDTNGPQKAFYQALIMACAAFVHLQRRNLDGAVNLLVSAHNHMEQFPPRYMAFPVREFLDLLETWHAKVELMKAVNEVNFTPQQLPLIEPPAGEAAARLIPV